MLLTGGGLLLQTFVHLRATNLGFDPENVLVGSVNPPGAGGYDTAEKHRAFYDQVLERARALPGVRRAALASVLPLGGDSDMSIAIEGRPAPSSRSQMPVAWYRLVSAEYFETIGTRITIGRSFADRPSDAVGRGQRDFRPYLLPWRRTARQEGATRQRRQPLVHGRRRFRRRQDQGRA